MRITTPSKFLAALVLGAAVASLGPALSASAAENTCREVKLGAGDTLPGRYENGVVSVESTVVFADAGPAAYDTCTVELEITASPAPGRRPSVVREFDCVKYAQSNKRFAAEVREALAASCDEDYPEYAMTATVRGTDAGAKFSTPTTVVVDAAVCDLAGTGQAVAHEEASAADAVFEGHGRTAQEAYADASAQAGEAGYNFKYCSVRSEEL